MGQPDISTLLLYTLPSSQSPSILKVQVVPDINSSGQPTGSPLIVSWVNVPGAVNYIINASPSPIYRNVYKIIPAFDPITGIPNLSIRFTPSLTLPTDIVWHFWVNVDFGNNTTKFIQDTPAFIEENHAFDANVLDPSSQELMLDEGTMKDYIQQIRQRSLAMIQNDGEEFYLYMRRWIGMPCHKCYTEGTGDSGLGTGMVIDKTTGLFARVAVDSVDPELQGTNNCTECFGTGIFGGFYPKIKILARYGNIPHRRIKWNKGGLDIAQDFNSWTTWFPRIHKHDFLIRARTGERFSLGEEVGTASWRGIATQQTFNAVLLTPTDIRYAVTDEAVQAAVVDSSKWDTMSWDWGVWA